MDRREGTLLIQEQDNANSGLFVPGVCHCFLGFDFAEQRSSPLRERAGERESRDAEQRSASAHAHSPRRRAMRSQREKTEGFVGAIIIIEEEEQVHVQVRATIKVFSDARCSSPRRRARDAGFSAG